MQYLISFSNLERVVIHTEYVSTEIIINFNVDHMASKLIIYSKLPKLKEGHNFKCTIFDLLKNKIVFEQLVTNTELHGRLESGIYSILDGHIYYNNKVIKIRYDLIEKRQAFQLTENQIFDYYQDIFSLQDGEKIMVGCPLDSKCMSKLVYIMRNPKHLKKARIMVLPYLHQKRLYLNRKKMNTEYFYTSIRQEIPSYIKHMVSSDEYRALQAMKSIISINLTESKYYVFSARGILRNRVKFSHIIHEFGKLI